MSSRTPYDHTTPPTSPQTNAQPRTPRPARNLGILGRIVDPHQTSQAAASPRIPRQVSREGQNAARDGWYYPATEGTTMPEHNSSTPKLPTSSFTFSPTISFYGRRLDSLHLRPAPSKQTTPRKSARDTLREMRPLGSSRATAPKDTDLNASKKRVRLSKVKVPVKPPAKPTVNEELSNTAKTTTSATKIRRRRRPSEIFNMKFSFGAPSIRRSEDHTPQISPRTSFDQLPRAPPCSSASSISGPRKPNRIDSTNSNARTPSYSASVPPQQQLDNDFGLRASADDPDTIWIYKGQPFCPALEAHPGELVTFSSPKRSRPENLREDSQSYHDFLAKVARRNSAPGVRRSCDPSSMEATKSSFQAQRTEKESRILYLSDHKPQLIQPSPLLQFAPWPSVSTSSTSSSSETTSISTAATSPSCAPDLAAASSLLTSNKPKAKRTTSSMSDPSMEKFLSHVRASREMRSKMKEGKWQENKVFVDEDEKGFLSDEPL